MVMVKARSEGYVRASTDVTGSSGKERAAYGLLGLRKWGVQSEEKNGLLLALKQGNVAT